MNIMKTGWVKKLAPDYKKKSYYVRKTSRPYAQELSPVEKHVRGVLISSKKRALERGIEWNLTFADLQIPKYCPYLGCELTYIRGEGRKQTNFSLDRIDPKKGYVPDNIEIISDLANRMKQEATKEQLIAFATGVFKKYNCKIIC